MMFTQLANGLLMLASLSAQIQETRQEWNLAPRWQPGLELTYRGKVEEQSTAPGVTFQRSYTLEARMLVLDVRRELANCAFLTTLGSSPRSAAAARLEIASVEPLGRLIPPNHVSVTPPEGPATWERGFMVELPRAVLGERTRWMVPDLGRPLKQWELVGPAAVGGTPCVCIRSVQESEDWQRPRADQTAWQIKEQVYVSSRTGYTHRLERTLVRRSPARQEPDYQATTVFDLESCLTYDGSFLSQRRRDVEQVTELAGQMRAMKDGARPATPPEWKTLLAKIDLLAQQPGGTAYREGLASLRALALAASENRLLDHALETTSPRLTLGQAAPEFVTQQLGGEQSVTLRQWRGKVVLMAFFLPQSDRATDVLLFLQRMQREHRPEQFLAAAMSMSDDWARIKIQQDRLGLTLPVYAGKSLHHSYGVEATPRFVLLDGQGRVQLLLLGWGPETRERLQQAIHRACAP